MALVELFKTPKKINNTYPIKVDNNIATILLVKPSTKTFFVELYFSEILLSV